MRRSVDTTINGTTYSITTLGGVNGTRVALKLQAALGEAIVRALAGSEGAEADAVGIVTRYIASPEFEPLLWQLLDGARCSAIRIADGTTTAGVLVDGANRGNFDLHFAGNFGDLIPLVWHALRENFGGFFSANSAALNALLERAAGATRGPGQSPPTGSPGSAPSRSSGASQRSASSTRSTTAPTSST